MDKVIISKKAKKTSDDQKKNTAFKFKSHFFHQIQFIWYNDGRGKRFLVKCEYRDFGVIHE